MQKSSVAANYLDVIAVSDEKAKKDSEKKHKKHAEGKKPYSETAEQIQNRRKQPELTEEEIFQRKLNQAIQRKKKEVQDERERLRKEKERAAIDDQIERIARTKKNLGGN